MAINKDSNAYNFGFAIALVVVVGVILALVSITTRPIISKNDEVQKKLAILKAMMDTEKENITRANAAKEFEKYVDLDDAIVLDMNGQPKEGNAFEVNIRREYRDKNLAEEDKSYPLFIAHKDGKKLYVLPVVGNGLWGAIWGNITLGEDMQTIVGASFDHEKETPGLGAEIKQSFFIDRWIGEKISDASGNFTKFEVVKNNSGDLPSKIDGITGGTITSKGVEKMANRCLKIYTKYFKTKE